MQAIEIILFMLATSFLAVADFVAVVETKLKLWKKREIVLMSVKSILIRKLNLDFLFDCLI